PRDHQALVRGAHTMAERLLDVKNLKTYFFTDEGVVRAVDGVDLYIEKGETLGIVGESGCGKSVTALSIMKLIPQPPGKIVEGEILYNGRDLVNMPANQMRKIRGKEISMIFQEPMTSLNPVFTCGEQIAEALRLLNELKNKLKMAVMLITHDMGVIAETAQRVVVMYAAKVAEEASVADLFKEPLHPYTQGLLRSIPRIDLAATERRRLETIPGTVPTLRGDIAPGCRFAPRCPFVKSVCTEKD